MEELYNNYCGTTCLLWVGYTQNIYASLVNQALLVFPDRHIAMVNSEGLSNSFEKIISLCPTNDCSDIYTQMLLVHENSVFFPFSLDKFSYLL